jgi:hypothetical protein
VQEKDDEPRCERRRTVLAGLRNPRLRERPGDEDDREHNQPVREPPRRRAERVREAKEQVGEDDDQDDCNATDCPFRNVAGMVRDERQQLEQAERAEGNRRPPARAIAATQPEDERDRSQRDVREEVEISEGLNRVVQGRIPRSDNGRTVRPDPVVVYGPTGAQILR